MLSSQSVYQHCEDFAGKCLVVLTTNSVDVVKAEELQFQEECACITYWARALVEWQMTLPDTKFAGALKKGWMMSSCFLLFLVIATMPVNTLPV